MKPRVDLIYINFFPPYQIKNGCLAGKNRQPLTSLFAFQNYHILLSIHINRFQKTTTIFYGYSTE